MYSIELPLTNPKLFDALDFPRRSGKHYLADYPLLSTIPPT
jgi:hypothetical protein